MNRRAALAILLPCVAASLPGVAAAQNPVLSIELNGMAASTNGCKLTFLADNGMAQSLAKVSFEFVFFDAKGLVERMAVLDFRDLPAGKQKVRQFDVPGTDCTALKGLLINDTPVCDGVGLAKDACMKALRTGSKTTADLKG